MYIRILHMYEYDYMGQHSSCKIYPVATFSRCHFVGTCAVKDLSSVLDRPFEHSDTLSIESPSMDRTEQTGKRARMQADIIY